MLVALRNAVVHLLATVPAESCPEAIEWLQTHPSRTHKLIGIPGVNNGPAFGVSLASRTHRLNNAISWVKTVLNSLVALLTGPYI